MERPRRCLQIEQPSTFPRLVDLDDLVERPLEMGALLARRARAVQVDLVVDAVLALLRAENRPLSECHVREPPEPLRQDRRVRLEALEEVGAVASRETVALVVARQKC